jgi:hypothetical protein
MVMQILDTLFLDFWKLMLWFQNILKPSCGLLEASGGLNNHESPDYAEGRSE